MLRCSRFYESLSVFEKLHDLVRRPAAAIIVDNHLQKKKRICHESKGGSVTIASKAMYTLFTDDYSESAK